MPKNLQDCYFFYYSACRKVNPYSFLFGIVDFSITFVNVLIFFFVPEKIVHREPIVRIDMSQPHLATNKFVPIGRQERALSQRVRIVTWSSKKNETKFNVIGRINRMDVASHIVCSSIPNLKILPKIMMTLNRRHHQLQLKIPISIWQHRQRRQHPCHQVYKFVFLICENARRKNHTNYPCSITLNHVQCKNGRMEMEF